MTEKAYSFAQFDPRNTDEATRKNEKILEKSVLGIEVTVPDLAEKCMLGNIDPQHTEGIDEAAIERSEDMELPSENATLATVRADVDSVGAMAVLDLRARGEDLSPAAEWIERIAESDKFSHGGWPGKRILPSKENPWPDEAASAESTRDLAAIAACVADFKVPLEDRVSYIEKWLLTGEDPEEYREKVEKERSEMVKALEDGTIEVNERNDGKIAVVKSTHRAATMVGYHVAPVVVALNPKFRFQGGKPHRKFTVCQFEAGYVDLQSAFAELSKLEEGWGGSPTIGGSPQGTSSKLSIDQVVTIIKKHMIS